MTKSAALPAALWRLVGAMIAKARQADSPVLVRELRARMRGTTPFAVMFLYVSVLGIAVLLTVPSLGSLSLANQAAMGLPPLGRTVFLALAGTQLGLVCCFTPGLTSSVVSGEWERRTIELLGLTLLPSRSIVLGKFTAALCYVGLLLLCSVPIFSLTLLLGGVAPSEIVLLYGLTALAAVFLAALGLLASSLVRRSYIATGIAYGAAGFLILGLPVASQSVFGLTLLGALSVAGVLTVAARWWLPRVRPAWRPARAWYLAIWGGAYCGCTALLNVPWYEQWATANLLGWWLANPVAVISTLYSMGHGYGPGASKVLPFLLFLALTGSLALAALTACVSLMRAARAPESDSLETQARVDRERRLERRAARGVG